VTPRHHRIMRSSNKRLWKHTINNVMGVTVVGRSGSVRPRPEQITYASRHDGVDGSSMKSLSRAIYTCPTSACLIASAEKV